MDGKELYQWLKERHPKLTDGVIFTTGDVMGGGDTEIFLEQTARPILLKPFTPAQLKSIVKGVLS
jgi:CheY-like chemotaxis protein